MPMLTAASTWSSVMSLATPFATTSACRPPVVPTGAGALGSDDSTQPTVSAASARSASLKCLSELVMRDAAASSGPGNIPRREHHDPLRAQHSVVHAHRTDGLDRGELRRPSDGFPAAACG